MTLTRLLFFLAIGAAFLTASAAPGDHKSCEACINAKWFFKFVWCDKGKSLRRLVAFRQYAVLRFNYALAYLYRDPHRNGVAMHRQ